MDLEFSDLTYTVNRRWRGKEGTTLLHGISGVFRSGQLSAIMGPSGAGKSTLLNILSGYRASETQIHGVMKLNGKPLDHGMFHKSTRYITQEDLLPPLLTVFEAMMFAANLKLPSATSREKKEAEINHILGMLGLCECAGTMVEVLSGGQKKRLSLALEMINNPKVFFLDEPTSGLDNVSTKQCLQLLSTLAKEERMIVCTIHQPSTSTFELFDHVYILGHGRCVYQGPSCQLLPFLSSMGFHCPTYHSPTDFGFSHLDNINYKSSKIAVMELIDSSDSNISTLSKAIGNGKLSHLQSSYADAEHNRGSYSDASFNALGMKADTCEDNSNLKFKAVDYPISCCQQFVILLKRKFQQFRRNKTALNIAFLHHLSCGLLVGCVFYKSANDAHQMFNHMKFCVGYVLFFTYTNVMMPILTYPSEVKLLKKEYFNRWYSLHSYYAAIVVMKLPMQIVFGFIFSTLVYFMSGLPTQFLRFALFFFIGFVVTLVSDSIGMAIGSVFSVTNGSAVGPALVAPLLGLAVYGFDFARQVSWLTYAIMKLSFIRCAVVATAITLFSFGRETLECNEVYCHFKDPKVILDFLDVEHVSVWSEILVLFILLIFFRIVNYYALRHRVSVK